MIAKETNASPAAEDAVLRRTTTAKSAPKHKLAPSPHRLIQTTQSESRSHSKQNRVVSMLRRTEGVTIAAVMKATGWQKHSVHGFFAGVIRKKLGLNLVSAVTDGKRTYRIAERNAGKGSKTGKKPRTSSSSPRRPAAT